MLRNLIFICLFAVNAYAVTGFTWFWNVKLTGDTATVLRLKSNNDTTLNWSNRISDTLNRKVVHFGSGSLTHDSTLRYLRVDTLRSNPNVDSITIRHAFIDTLHGLLYNKGRVVSDTTATTYGSATYFTGDSIYNRAIRNTGTVTSDSANIRAIGGTTKTDSINSIKGIKAPVFVGPVVGNVTGISDSATGSVRAAKLTTARTISGTSFDGSANVTIIPDSAKGTHHLNGGIVNADSLNVHGTVIQRNGFLGVGTTAPPSKITIDGDSTQAMQFMSGVNIMMRPVSNTYDMRIYASGSGGNPANTNIDFSEGGTTRTPIMRIVGSGNVGIGTTSPVSPLTVKGNFVDTGNALIKGTLTADSIYTEKLGGNYGTFACTLGNVTTTVTGTASYYVIGKLITIVFPEMTGLATGTVTLTIKGIPLILGSGISVARTIATTGFDNGANTPISITASNLQTWDVFKIASGGTFTNGATCGIGGGFNVGNHRSISITYFNQ